MAAVFQWRTCSPQLAVNKRQRRGKLWGVSCQALINKMFRSTPEGPLERRRLAVGIALRNLGFLTGQRVNMILMHSEKTAVIIVIMIKNNNNQAELFHFKKRLEKKPSPPQMSTQDIERTSEGKTTSSPHQGVRQRFFVPVLLFLSSSRAVNQPAWRQTDSF